MCASIYIVLYNFNREWHLSKDVTTANNIQYLLLIYA